jgi:hypothetical protein
MPEAAPSPGTVPERAVDALLERQTPEGFWHDYELEVGSSRAWTTAYVGTSLIPYAHLPRVGRSLERAAHAVSRIGSADGWGYNLVTAADADSTAWCVRFLCAMGRDLSRKARAVLLPFVGPSGDVHTFHGERYGSWDTAHDDVAAMVALALAESGAPTGHARLIAARVIGRLGSSRPPRPFWWADDIYLWQAALGLADRLDLRTAAARRAARRHAAISDPRLTQDPASSQSVFRCALGIPADEAAARIAAKTGDAVPPFLSERAVRARRMLPGLQAENGLWAPSAWMRVPGQRDPGAASELAVDIRGLVTTATCLMALSVPSWTWLACGG